MAKAATAIEQDIRRTLGGLPFEYRGLWHEMRHLIDTESDRPGHLQVNGRPLSGEELAFRAGASHDTVARLIPRLVEVGLVTSANGCYVSRQLAALAERREKRRDLTRTWRQAGGERRSVRRREDRKTRGSAPREEGASAGVSRDTHCDRAVTGAQPIDSPLPSSGSPPTTPSPTSTPLPSSVPSERADGGLAADNGGGAVQDRPPRKRSIGPHHGLVEHFTAAWAAKYGRKYPFRGGRDGTAAKQILIDCEGSETDATAAVDRFLADDDGFFNGHRLSLLASQITKFMFDAPLARRPASGKKNANAHHHHAPAPDPDPGQFPEPDRDLPGVGGG